MLSAALSTAIIGNLKPVLLMLIGSVIVAVDVAGADVLYTPPWIAILC